MKRIVSLLCQHLMRLYTHHHIGGLNTDHQILIAKLFNHMYLIKSALHNALCCDTMVFFHQFLFQGTAVDSYTDGNISFLCSPDNRRYLILPADISGIDPDLVCAVFDCRDCHLIVKMDVCHQRNGNLLLNFPDCLCRFHRRHRAADNLTARLFQFVDLLHRRLDILRSGVGHGLDQDGIPSPDHSISNLNDSRMLSGHGRSSKINLSILVYTLWRGVSIELDSVYFSFSSPASSKPFFATITAITSFITAAAAIVPCMI